MGKSRQGCEVKASELIISKPEQLTNIQRWGDFTATMVFWALIFYLWQPLISIIAWSFGVKLFYEHMIVLGGTEKLLLIVGMYAFYVAILGGLLILWAKTNRWRFKDKCNRKVAPGVTDEMIADHYMLKHKVHEKIKDARNVSLWISQEFEITSRINQVEEPKPYFPLETNEVEDKEEMPDVKPDNDNGNILPDNN
mgnify:CR=1 FL=1